MSITISEAVKQMLAIVEKLCAAYPHKHVGRNSEAYSAFRELNTR
jgi:hypothetical protein